MLKDYSHPNMHRKRLLQQDGAPSHSSKEVRAWSNENFNGRWIRRDNPISRTRHSPVLTPFDFVLWGYIKTKIYETKVNDIVESKERTEQEIKTIKKETMENVFDGLVKRLNCCIDVNDGTFEQHM